MDAENVKNAQEATADCETKSTPNGDTILTAAESPTPAARNLNITGLVVLIVGLSIAVIGFLFGGGISICQKAIRICLECIGIG